MPLTPSPSPGGRGEQPSLLRNTTMYVRLFAALAQLEEERRIRPAVADAFRMMALTGIAR